MIIHEMYELFVTFGNFSNVNAFGKGLMGALYLKSFIYQEWYCKKVCFEHKAIIEMINQSSC